MFVHTPPALSPPRSCLTSPGHQLVLAHRIIELASPTTALCRVIVDVYPLWVLSSGMCWKGVRYKLAHSMLTTAPPPPPPLPVTCLTPSQSHTHPKPIWCHMDLASTLLSPLSTCTFCSAIVCVPGGSVWSDIPSVSIPALNLSTHKFLMFSTRAKRIPPFDNPSVPNNTMDRTYITLDNGIPHWITYWLYMLVIYMYIDKGLI